MGASICREYCGQMTVGAGREVQPEFINARVGVCRRLDRLFATGRRDSFGAYLCPDDRPLRRTAREVANGAVTGAVGRRSNRAESRETLVNKTIIATLALFAPLTLSSVAVAQTVPPKVDFKTIADMPTLKDNSKQDTFTVSLTDGQIKTNLMLACTAGHTDLFVVRKDKVCAFQTGSSGSILNPKTQQWLPRAQYVGSYSVAADGTTDAKAMSINYLALGTVAPSQAQFGGSLNLKPELTSSGAAGLKDLVLNKIQGGSASPINTAVDTIDFNHFFVPGAGLPSDKGCTWTGNAVFAYQTYSWFFKVTAECSGKSYELSGNMPFTDSPGVEGQTQYDLVLTLPSATTASDDALFADATGGDGDLFAAADGISGQIIMKNSNNVTVTVDNEQITTPAYVDASGSLTGTNVPLELVRSFATVIGILPSTFFGA